MARHGSVATTVEAKTHLAPTPVPTPHPTPKSVGTSTLTCGSPTGTPQGLSEMDVGKLSNMTATDRLKWYTQQLGSYKNELRNSAACNRIPQQLLATVIINELADINWQDVWQQRFGLDGSLGIAQIQVKTAKSHDLVLQPTDKSAPSDGEIKKRLTIPAYAIEAAAREIKLILEEMTKNRSNPWQQSFAFSLTSMSSLGTPNDIYNYIAGTNPREQEQNLAEMVTAAYNSPDILRAKQHASITQGAVGFIYSNGTIHGSNASWIARELFDNNLYR